MNQTTFMNDIFAANLFHFDETLALQTMTANMDQDMFSAPPTHMPLEMMANQEVLLSSILNPSMDDQHHHQHQQPMMMPTAAPIIPAMLAPQQQAPITNNNNNNDTMTNNNNTMPNKKPIIKSRDWKVISCCPESQSLLNEQTVKISIKTRDDKQANFNVPDKLYSSLRYVLSQKLESAFLANKQTVLMSKIQIVNPQTQEEIRKKNNEYVIDKGNTMVELKYNADSKCYECTEKIKFLDNSYRHNDIKFAFKVSFYDASQPAFLTKSPVLELLSAPFHVRARRPPKNKREEEEEEMLSDSAPSTSSPSPVPAMNTMVQASQPMPSTTTTATTAATTSTTTSTCSTASPAKIVKKEKRKADEVCEPNEDSKKKVKLMLKPLQTPTLPPVLPPVVEQPSPNSSKKIMSLLEKLALSINALPENERDMALELARNKLGSIETLKQPVPFDAFATAAAATATSMSAATPAASSSTMTETTSSTTTTAAAHELDLNVYSTEEFLSFEKFI